MKRKSSYLDGPRLIGVGLMITGVVYFLFFLLLAEIFGFSSVFDPLPFFFFIFVFAMGLLLVTNSIRVKPHHQQLQYCPNCHRALSKNELLGIWYCSSCKSEYDSNLGLSFGFINPRSCPVCFRPLAFDERFGRWFCHHCKKKYESRVFKNM